MSALQSLEDAFVKFQRLNTILKDNWNDNTKDAYESGHLTPIMTEWSQYHGNLTDMRNRLRQTEREIEEERQELDRLLSEADSEECSLNGMNVYGFYHTDGQISRCGHFLTRGADTNYMDDADFQSVAFNHNPRMEDIHDIHLVEPIYIS